MATRIGIAVFAAALVGLAAGASAGTKWYVGNNGVDGAGCGTRASPCRSISQAIANATDGDKIVVGPGRYTASEETPAPNCGCMLALNKAVDIESTNGAAETVIDGRGSPEARTILVINDGGTFGRPGKGFFVTQSGGGNHQAMVLDANDVAIRGNQFVPVLAGSIGIGIETVDSAGSVRFEGNQVIGWATGIYVLGPNKVIRKNVVANNGSGIVPAAGSVVTGNVVVGNDLGIVLPDGAATISGNAAVGNLYGIGNHGVGPPGGGRLFTGVVEKNNLSGNSCGIANDGLTGLVATGNYWGASTGPGPDPADDVCNTSAGTTVTTPFAASPFKIKPAIKP